MASKRFIIVLFFIFLFLLSFVNAQEDLEKENNIDNKIDLFVTGSCKELSFYNYYSEHIYYLLEKLNREEKNINFLKIPQGIDVNLIDKLAICNDRYIKSKDEGFTKYQNLSELYITNMSKSPFDYKFKNLNTLYVIHAIGDFGVGPRISNFHLNQIGELKKLQHVVIVTQKIYKIPEKIGQIDNLKTFFIHGHLMSPFFPLGLLIKDIKIFNEAKIEDLDTNFYSSTTIVLTPEIYAFYSVGILDTTLIINKNKISYMKSILNTHQKQNSKNGKFTLNYKNGDKLTVGKFKNGKPVGEWKFYYPNGNLYSIRRYKQGLENGIWYKFTETGDTILILKFDKGLLTYSYEKSDNIYGEDIHTRLEVLEYKQETPKKVKLSIYYDNYEKLMAEFIFDETYLTPYENLDDFLLYIVRTIKIDKKYDYKMDYEFRFWDKEGKLVHDLKYKKGVLQN